MNTVHKQMPPTRPGVLASFVLALAFASNCADTLLTSEGFAGQPPGGTPAVSASTTYLGNGIFETALDATSHSQWVYFDFEAQNQISVADAAIDANWDVAFQRFMIKANSGVSGNAGVTVVALNADNFSARVQAPTPFTPELSDLADPGDGSACRPTTPGVLFALLNSAVSPSACWFSYAAGVLTSRDIAYVLKTATPRYFKLKILSYYGPTGTSGKFRFQWGEVSAP